MTERRPPDLARAEGADPTAAATSPQPSTAATRLPTSSAAASLPPACADPAADAADLAAAAGDAAASSRARQATARRGLDPRAALAAWSQTISDADAALTPLAGGLINQTWRVIAARGSFVLQAVNPIFGPGVHDNILAVTEALVGAGLSTPRLIHTDEGALCSQHDGARYRLWDFIPGVTHSTVTDLSQARSAAALVGRFHRALSGLPHEFRDVRRGVHDTPAHLERLFDAVSRETAHRLHAQVAAIGHAIAHQAGELPTLPMCHARVGHGDLKLDNVRFDPTGTHAICLLDLDTVAPMQLSHELGDLWRSWCNPRGEDAVMRDGELRVTFDLDIFAASVQGLRQGWQEDPPADELLAVLLGPEWIALELAARFACDALEERYFGWDPSRHAGRGEHNLHRARVQWALFQATLATRAERARLLGV